MKKFSNRAISVVVAGVVLNLVLGVLYAWSVLAKALAMPVEKGGQWLWSPSQASLPYAIALAVFALSMTVAGKLQDKYGPRPIAVIGGVLVGAGMLIASLATPGGSHLPILLGFGVLTGIGIGFGYSAATPPAVKWFGLARKGLVSGIVVAGFGLASIYISPLTTWLLGHDGGVQLAFRALGIAFIVVAVGAAMFLVNPPEDYVAPEKPVKAGAKAPAAVVDRDWKYLLKTPKFYVIWLAYACSLFAGLMIIGHMAKIVVAKVPSFEQAFLLVAVLAIGNASGRVIAGFLLDKIGAVATMLIAFLGQAAALMLLSITTSISPLIVLAICIGAFYGALLAIFPAMTTGFFGTKNFGINYGMVFTAYGVGGFFGAMTAGKIFEATGSYNNAFYVAAGLCVLAAVLAPIAGRKLAHKD